MFKIPNVTVLSQFHGATLEVVSEEAGVVRYLIAQEVDTGDYTPMYKVSKVTNAPYAAEYVEFVGEAADEQGAMALVLEDYQTEFPDDE